MAGERRVGILASGRGSNFEALQASAEQDRLGAKIVCFATDQPQCQALHKARQWKIPSLSVDAGRKRGRLAGDSEKQLLDFMQAHRVDLICLAGFMRIVRGPLLNAYPSAILNIHPSLLPAFPGLEAVKQALDYGAKISGCTVHLVDAGIDSGPILLQTAVHIEDNDSVETLAARILEQEHRLYSQAVRMWANGEFEIQGRRVRRQAPESASPAKANS